MSEARQIRIVRQETSAVIHLETVDPDDDCTITDRICVGAEGSTRFLWIIKEMLRGSQWRLVRK